MKKSSLLKAVGMVSGLCLVAPTYATIVDIETSVGTIQVNLFDESTPKTVENFLAYVADDSYIDTIIHRNEPNFVVQGGGFKYSGTAFNLNPIETKGTVENEPVWSNVAGTIAMAKVEGNPDSATSQWFFNVVDNSANLDFQNEGFTAFGQVVSGMDIVEEIALGYGIENLEPKLSPSQTLGEKSNTTKKLEIISKITVGFGFTEALNSSLTSKKILFDFLNRDSSQMISVIDSKSQEHTILRDSILPGLVENLSKNIHESYPQRIFETGTVFSKAKPIFNNSEVIIFFKISVV